jgi:hypothetical protein
LPQLRSARLVGSRPKHDAFGLAITRVDGCLPSAIGALCFRDEESDWVCCGFTGHLGLAYGWLCGEVDDHELGQIPAERPLVPLDIDLAHWRFLASELCEAHE